MKIDGVIGIALVVFYAVGSGLWVNTGDNWYRSLNAPTWQPPNWVFGVIWPYNFIVFRTSLAMGFALLPYQIWVILAANLSAAYARLN